MELRKQRIESDRVFSFFLIFFFNKIELNWNIKYTMSSLCPRVLRNGIAFSCVSCLLFIQHKFIAIHKISAAHFTCGQNVQRERETHNSKLLLVHILLDRTNKHIKNGRHAICDIYIFIIHTNGTPFIMSLCPYGMQFFTIISRYQFSCFSF